jgi:hypothetical protein
VEWDEWVRTAFEVFDVDGSGRLSVEDLNKLLCGDVCAVRHICRMFSVQQWRCGLIESNLHGAATCPKQLECSPVTGCRCPCRLAIQLRRRCERPTLITMARSAWLVSDFFLTSRRLKLCQSLRILPGTIDP